jgi:hypothetical protein
MNTAKPMFVREVARIDDPRFVSGQVAGHRARRLIDAPDAAFGDPFVLMAEDWAPLGLFGLHPHRGIETVTFVIEGAIEHRDSAGFEGVIQAGDAQWMTANKAYSMRKTLRPGQLLILCSSGLICLRPRRWLFHGIKTWWLPPCRSGARMELRSGSFPEPTAI